MKERKPLRTRVGEIVGAKMDKTITVRIERRVEHPTYRRILRRSVKLHAHDQENTGQVGDTVRIAPTRPFSKTKRWRLVEILRRGGEKYTLPDVGAKEWSAEKLGVEERETEAAS